MFFARVAPLVVLTLVSAGCTMMRTRDNPLTLEDESARDNSTLHSLRNRGVRSTVAQALGQGPDQDVARSLYAEAEALYKRDLEIFRKNGYALKGLYESLVAQGKKEEAREVKKRFDEAWQWADVRLEASKVVS